MEFDFSVVVLTYHPDAEKMMATLNSAVMQRGCKFEIIISDDGSSDFFEGEIHRFMEAHAFRNYRIIPHEKNQGTVRNLLDAVDAAKGKYIKPISPGDYLYDEHTLADVLAFMEDNHATVAFGDMIYYAFEKSLSVSNLKTPCDDTIYLAEHSDYDYKKVLKHQMIYSDHISGAAVIYETDCLKAALNEIKDCVTYAEDTVLQLFAVQNVRIYKLSRFVMWYEYGSGISTNPELRFSERLRRDFYKFYKMLEKNYGEVPYVKRTNHLWHIMMEEGKVKNFLRRCINVDKMMFLIRRKRILRQYTCASYDPQNFMRCVKVER